jgi:hypothetical protein
MTSHTRNGSTDDRCCSQRVILIDNAEAEPVSLAWLVMTMPSGYSSVRFRQFERHNAKWNRILRLVSFAFATH